MAYPKTRDEFYQWVADNSSVDENCEGTPEQTLMSGWINAMDTEEERGHLTDEEFLYFCYAEFNNMGYGPNNH